MTVTPTEYFQAEDRRATTMSADRLMRTGLVLGILMIGVLSCAVGHCSSEAKLSNGATVYLPVYSHIYVGIKGLRYELAISLIIRNTDPSRAIRVYSVDYYDSDGKLVRHFQQEPVVIPPLASKDFFVSQSDTTGGFGASFVVKWDSATKVNEPIIEGVMAGTMSGQGISFTTRGQVIEERGR